MICFERLKLEVAGEEALGVTTVVDRTPEVLRPSPEAIVVSNADDIVISTSGADDRFEVVPQVFVDGMTRLVSKMQVVM